MTANYWTCFLPHCQNPIHDHSETFWHNGNWRDSGFKVCCKHHIHRIWDDMDRKWVIASKEFDGAEDFILWEGKPKK